MTKQPEDWLDDVPGDDIEDEDDEIIWVSKSEIKRDAEELNARARNWWIWGKTRWIRSRWTPICATPLNWPSVSKWKDAAASCSLSENAAPTRR